MKKFILIDTHAIIHRSYHALPPLTSPKGEAVGAVYGFTSILLRILRELKPDFAAAAFDLPGPTFRHIAYERYKAQRPETPGDLSSQFPKVRKVLEAFSIPIFEKEGYEADDLIGTLVKKVSSKKDVETIIVTGDLDALQLVGPRVRVYSMKKGISETTTYDRRAVFERFGLESTQLIDFKGLKGDPSDNIPGVKGIGEKTAISLIKEFGSIENIYFVLKKNQQKFSASVAEKLRSGEEDAKFSKELATIKVDVPIEFSLDDTKRSQSTILNQSILKVFQEFGFSSLIKRLGGGGSTQAELTEVENQPVYYQEISNINDFVNFANKSKKEKVGFVLLPEGIFLIQKNPAAVFRVEKTVLKEGVFEKFLAHGRFVVYDAKAILTYLRQHNLRMNNIDFDMMLASYLANPFSHNFSFNYVLSRELGRMASEDSREELIHFWEAVEELQEKIKDGHLNFIFEKVEMPLVGILAEMEARGVLVDKEFLKGLSEEVGKELKELTKKILKLSGEDFNINSSQQLAKILFEKLKIKTYGLRKTEKMGVISTRESELVKLKGVHPVIDHILRYRELNKLKTTYIDVLPGLVDPKTGRVHTTFNQVGTSTGRLSSSDPNLQNIPAISEAGREIRKAFVARNGFLFASFDYSQIELRVAAHLADDKKMIKAFRDGLDIHKMTASEINNISLDKVTPDLRRAAKTLNFGILYGMGPQALAESTDMSLEEARGFIKEYFHDFSGVKDYLERTKNFAAQNGYVETLFGRRRYIPEIYSPNWQIKREAERMAINMPIQGSATGDIVKMAMIKVDDWIKREGLENDARMLLQVHDELVFEIKKDIFKKAATKVRELMEKAAELKVPLVVDVKAGENWGEQTILH